MIYILGGHHCDKRLSKKLIIFFKKVKPDLVCIEELTHDKRTLDLCNHFTDGRISLDTFKKQTKFEEYWFDFSPYKELFMYLGQNKIQLYPIDHSLKERVRLIKLEKKVLTEWYKKRDTTVLKEQVRQSVVFDRERCMVANTLAGITKHKSKIICVVVGNSHTDRVGDALGDKGFTVIKKHLSNKEEMERYYKRILNYAIKNKTATRAVPPLVPIFVEVAQRVK